MRKIKHVLLNLAVAAVGVMAVASCTKTSKTKVGVIRADASSGEALAWESYLNTLGEDLDLEFEFVTTDSSTAEVSAVNTFASKGCKGILLYSSEDVVSAVTACNTNEMWCVIPTGHPTDAQRTQIEDLPYYLGSVAPSSDEDYTAGYDMAKYFVEDLHQSTFTIFGGATCYASDMHVSRLTGMLSYLCENEGTSYDGAKTRYDIYGKVVGAGVDPTKFTSSTYTVTGYMDGFAFDDAFSTKLQQSMVAGGTAILSVGAGDAVTGIAYGIANAVSSIDVSSLKVGCVDAITSDYAPFFDMGYVYDCGKFASVPAPALVLLKRALNGNKLTDNGKAVKANMGYWLATSKAQLNSMLEHDNADDGYLYDANVINGYMDCTLSDFETWCAASYAEAQVIHNNYR